MRQGLIVGIIGALALTPAACAQGAEGGLQAGFEATGLAVGSPFPQVGIHDAAGKPFNTRSLKGIRTVVINGCLT